MDSNHKAKILGAAGTGKTIICSYKAVSLASLGLNTLLLCYNSNLADYLQEKYSEVPNLEIFSFHAFAKKIIDKYKYYLFPKSPDKEYWETECALHLLETITSEGLQYDAVLVDEAQDFKKDWWAAINELTQGDSKYYVFYDPGQNIYNSKEFLPELNTTLPLVENCRNTKNIHDLVLKHGVIKSISSDKCPAGEKVEIINYCDDNSLKDALSLLCRRLKKELKISSSNIMILGPQNYDNCILSSFHYSIGGYQIIPFSNYFPEEHEIRYETIHSFKGLESTVIIIIETEKINSEFYNEIIYVGASRAKSLLFIFGKN